jgi:hypothetical protein
MEPLTRSVFMPGQLPGGFSACSMPPLGSRSSFLSASAYTGHALHFYAALSAQEMALPVACMRA